MSFSDEYIRGKTCSSLSILTNCVAALGKPRFGGYRSGMRYTFEIGIVAAYVCMPVVGEFILEGPVGTPSSNRSEAWPPPRAGFWIRLFAGMIDLTLLVVPFAVFVSFFAAGMGISNPFFNHRSGTPLNDTLTQSGPTFLLICLAFFAAESWLYFAISESSAWHATLGKRLLGLYVADIAGKPVDFWRASVRFCTGRLLVHVPVLGGYYFVIDCLCVGLMPGKRAVHDMFSGCLVLREATNSSFVRRK